MAIEHCPVDAGALYADVEAAVAQHLRESDGIAVVAEGSLMPVVEMVMLVTIAAVAASILVTEWTVSPPEVESRVLARGGFTHGQHSQAQRGGDEDFATHIGSPGLEMGGGGLEELHSLQKANARQVKICAWAICK
jgi:hypothetical protein